MVQCDVCALRTAVVYCSADQAHLCAGCDLDVHSANAMSARHVREPLPVGFPRLGPPRRDAEVTHRALRRPRDSAAFVWEGRNICGHQPGAVQQCLTARKGRGAVKATL